MNPLGMLCVSFSSPLGICSVFEIDSGKGLPFSYIGFFLTVLNHCYKYEKCHK